MDLEIRPITADEWPAWERVDMLAFGWEADEDEIRTWRKVTDISRTLAAFDGKTIAGQAAAFDFDMTVPGGSASTAGVTWVAVRPSHRRRGVLTSLMRRQLDDLHAAGQPLAALWASESIIYGRFGYGLAAFGDRMEIERSHAQLKRLPRVSGDVRIIEREEAEPHMVAVYDKARLTRPGMMPRNAAWWDHRLLDSKDRRDGASPLIFAVYMGSAGAEGYVAYRIKNDWDGDFSAATVRIIELMSTSLDAHDALWRFCFSIDLTTTVRAFNRPVDDPLRFMLADPRRLVTHTGDSLWIRLVDVAAALCSRRYAEAESLTLEVVDDFCPWNAGTYALKGDPDDARCERKVGDADLRLDVADLGAAYLGGLDFSVLAGAGRVQELRPGALRRADRMFRWRPAPWCPSVF